MQPCAKRRPSCRVSDVTLPADTQFLQIEASAHEGAHGHNPRALPTESQHLAGNYKKGRTTWQGLRIAIEQPRGSYRTGHNPDGSRWSTRMAAHYGYFEGVKGSDGDGLDCFIGFYPQSEMVYVVNQHVNGRFDEHKCLICFPDQASAERAYRDSYERGWNGLQSIVPASLSQFKWWLKNGNKTRPLLPEYLPHEGFETMNLKTPIAWDASAQPVGMNAAVLLYEIRRSDADAGLLMDAVTRADILEDADEVMTMDAMVTPYAKVDRKMEILRGVMERASATVKPVALQVTDPFKQRGVVNVAGIFELSDGQTVSVYLHNPDTTPNKLAPTDELISWKWLLNKKDITIVVAPERGEDLNVREVARRIMKLAEKNSAAFQRANGKRAERMQAIQGLKDEIAGLEAELKQAQGDLEVAKVEAEELAIAKAESKDVEFSVTEEKAGSNKVWFINATYFDVKAHGRVYQSGFDGDVFKAEGPSRNGENSAVFVDSKTAIEWVKNQARIFYGLPVVDTSSSESGENGVGAAQEPITLTGNELGEFPDTPEGMISRRKATREHLEQNLKGRWIYVSAIGDSVEIRQSGIDESISWSAKPKKLKALSVLEKLIAGSHSPDYQPNRKPAKKPAALEYIHLKNTVSIDGEMVEFTVIVEVDLHGKLHYDITIDNSKAKAALDSSFAAHARVMLSRIPNPGFSPAEILMDAAKSGNYVLNLFIEGEEPEAIGEDEDVVEGVDPAKPVEPINPRGLGFEWTEYQRAPAMRLAGSTSGLVAVPARGNKDAATWSIINSATGEVVRKIQKPKLAKSQVERDLISLEEQARYGAGGYYSAMLQYQEDLKAFEEVETARLWASAPAVADVAAELQKINGWDVHRAQEAAEDASERWLGYYAGKAASDTELMQHSTREIWLNGNPIPKELANASAAELAAWIHVQEAVFAGDEDAVVGELADRYDPDTGEVRIDEEDGVFEQQLSGMPREFIRSALLVKSFTEALGGKALFGDFNHTVGAGLFDSAIQQLPFGVCAQIADGAGNLKGRADISANGEVLILEGATGTSPIRMPDGKDAAASSKDGAILAMLKAAIGSQGAATANEQKQPPGQQTPAVEATKNIAEKSNKDSLIDDLSEQAGIERSIVEDWVGRFGEDAARTLSEAGYQGYVVADILGRGIPPNKELMDAIDATPWITKFYAAKQKDIQSLSDQAFSALLGAQGNNSGDRIGEYAYLVLRHSRKQSELDYIGKLGRMSDSLRQASQQPGGVLHRMAQPYLAKQSAAAPSPASDPQKDAAIAMMQAIIDGSTDPLTADLDVLEQAFTSYQDDAEVESLFEQAVDVVMQAAAKATEGVTA